VSAVPLSTAENAVFNGDQKAFARAATCLRLPRINTNRQIAAAKAENQRSASF
jgi:hypothetical protein